MEWFDGELQGILLSVLTIAAGALLAQFKASGRWQKMSTRDRLIVRAVAIGVQWAYVKAVKKWKLASPTGKLSDNERTAARTIAKNKARETFHKATGGDSLDDLMSELELDMLVESRVAEVKPSKLIEVTELADPGLGTKPAN